MCHTCCVRKVGHLGTPWLRDDTLHRDARRHHSPNQQDKPGRLRPSVGRGRGLCKPRGRAGRRGGREGGVGPSTQREKKLGRRQNSAALKRPKSKYPARNIPVGFQGPQKRLNRAECPKTIAFFLPTSNHRSGMKLQSDSIYTQSKGAKGHRARAVQERAENSIH